MLACTAWTFAILDRRTLELFEAALEKAEDRLEDLISEALENIVWAHATLDRRAPKLFEAVANGRGKLAGFQPSSARDHFLGFCHS